MYNGGMDLEPRPNHKQHIQVLRSMSPGQRLQKAFELSEFSKRLFIAGLRQRFPELSDEQFHRLALERLAKCHNRNVRRAAGTNL